MGHINQIFFLPLAGVVSAILFFLLFRKPVTPSQALSGLFFGGVHLFLLANLLCVAFLILYGLFWFALGGGRCSMPLPSILLLLTVIADFLLAWGQVSLFGYIGKQTERKKALSVAAVITLCDTGLFFLTNL